MTKRAKAEARKFELEPHRVDRGALGAAYKTIRSMCRSQWEASTYAHIESCLEAGVDIYKDIRSQFERQRWTAALCGPGEKRTLEEIVKAANGNSEYNIEAPIDANYGLRIDYAPDVVILDIDEPNWPSVLLGIEEDFREIRDAPRVLTPHGAHVYFRIARRMSGRWKHISLPCMLIGSGHVMGIGSIVDGSMYIPDPMQPNSPLPCDPGRLPMIEDAPGGSAKWPGFGQTSAWQDSDS